MTRYVKFTLCLLLVNLVILMLAFLGLKSLKAGRYELKDFESLKNIAETMVPREIVNRYNKQFEGRIRNKLGPYAGLHQADAKDRYSAIANMVLIGLTAVAVCFVSFLMFFGALGKEQGPGFSRGNGLLILLLIILNGTIIRLLLAWACYGNFDMQCCDIIGDIVLRGGNVYAETVRYNYSPVWFTILGQLKRMQLQIPALEYHFFIRAFLTVVDLFTLGVLVLIARQVKVAVIKPVMFFYLNPVGILLTGYHGQFENIAILAMLLGIYAYLRLSNMPVVRVAVMWALVTAGVIIKHIIVYELIICLVYAVKRWSVRMTLLTVSGLLFFAMFIPYWDRGSQGIIKNVFMHGGGGLGKYGFTLFFALPHLKYLFVAGLFLFPLILKDDNILRRCLLGMLFFLVFTTASANQYYILPIALWSLQGSRGGLVFSLAACCYLLGSMHNVAVPVFHLFGRNIVWAAAIYWFITEMRISNGEVLSKINSGFERFWQKIYAERIEN